MSGTGQPPSSNAGTPANRPNTSGDSNNSPNLNGPIVAPSGLSLGGPAQPRSIDAGAANMGSAVNPGANGALSQQNLNQIVSQ